MFGIFRVLQRYRKIILQLFMIVILLFEIILLLLFYKINVYESNEFI
jgi:hypothetical protein